MFETMHRMKLSVSWVFAAHEFSVIRTVLVVAAPKILAEVSPSVDCVSLT